MGRGLKGPAREMTEFGESAADGERRPPIEVVSPDVLTTPFVFASPHSGRRYPGDLLRISRLDRHALRQSEDSYVDLLFDDAPRFGAPLLRALFPRAYVDVNRSRHELDPRMFADPLPRNIDGRSNRVLAGLGVIPRVVADGKDIYGRKLNFFEARRRLTSCYDPYHQAVSDLMGAARRKFGCAILIDCHSMPSVGVAPIREGDRRIDFVLGDRFGASCAPSLISLVEMTLSRMGYQVSRNAPYAGGFVAAAYGRPLEGAHVLQIEINRALYIDETRLARTAGYDQLKADLKTLMGELARIEPAALRPAQAAE
jgi:N-formylglutamate amidohydrolase